METNEKKKKKEKREKRKSFAYIARDHLIAR